MPVLLPVLLATPPAVAVLVGMTWLLRPDLHRDATLRGALIVSICIAGIEALLAVLGLAFLWFLSRSNLDF
jgi:hypothetical protein